MNGSIRSVPRYGVKGLHDDLTIGKLAKAASVGVETVRYYQRRGLLPTPSPAKNYRHYGASHVERLLFIRRAQGIGFSLKEVAELLALNDSRDHRVARRLASRKIHDLEERIDHMKKVAKALRRLVHECECGGQDMPCPIIRMALKP
jgi:MerR family mercuric resistance operon transcriptional regulator